MAGEFEPQLPETVGDESGGTAAENDEDYYDEMYGGFGCHRGVGFC